MARHKISTILLENNNRQSQRDLVLSRLPPSQFKHFSPARCGLDHAPVTLMALSETARQEED